MLDSTNFFRGDEHDNEDMHGFHFLPKLFFPHLISLHFQKLSIKGTGNQI